MTKNEKMINDLYFRSSLHSTAPSPQNPRVLILMHGNYTCNLNCIYCEHHLLREDYQKAVMTEETAEQVVRKLGPMIRELTWHGGEPTLLPMSLVKKVEEVKHELNLDFRTTLQTNSVALTPQKIKIYKELGIDWGTSFDGIDNDRNRGKKSTEGIFRLREMMPEDEIPGFITVYINDTKDHMIDNYEYFKKNGFTSFQSAIVRENVVENTNPYLISAEDSVAAVLKYFKYWMYDTNNPIADGYLVRQLERVLGHTKICEDGNCIRGWIIVDPFGNIGQCGQAQSSNGIVNVYDIKDYNDLFFHPKFLSEVGKQKALIDECRKSGCPWLSVCNGGCMGNNYEHDPTYKEINPRGCEYNKALLVGIYELVKDIDINDPKYNPVFTQVLKENCYFSLSEIKEIEERKLRENNG